MDLAGRRRRHQMRHVIGAAHIWLGLTLGLVWSLQGLTGAMLVFHRELDRLTLVTPHPAVRPLERLIAAAQQQQLPAQAEAIGVIDVDPSVLSVAYPDSAGEIGDNKHPIDLYCKNKIERLNSTVLRKW